MLTEEKDAECEEAGCGSGPVKSAKSAVDPIQRLLSDARGLPGNRVTVVGGRPLD